MTRVTRYVLLELLKVFIVALTGMTLLMILVGLAQEAIRQGLGFEPIIRLIPYVLPNALRFAVPGTMLFAACLVFGRMSATNEVVAIKSMGISPMSLIAPALVLAIMTSCVAVWLNDVAVSWGRRGMHRVVLQSVEDIVYGMLRTHRSYSNKNIAINVKKVDGKRLVRVTLTRHNKDHSRPMVVTADEAELTSNFENNTLKITLFNAHAEFGDQAALEFPDKLEVEIPLTDAAKKGGGARGPSDFAWSEIPAEIISQKKKISDAEQEMAADAAYQLATGDFNALADPDWTKRRNALNGSRERLYRLYTERWRRWANGFSCFFFVMVGAPLAVHFRNADVWSTFGKSFLPILGIYYPLLAYGVDRAKCGALPPYSVWLGNAILLLVGLWLIRKVRRY